MLENVDLQQYQCMLSISRQNACLQQSTCIVAHSVSLLYAQTSKTILFATGRKHRHTHHQRAVRTDTKKQWPAEYVRLAVLVHANSIPLGHLPESHQSVR
jgi:hypothetical protein